MLTVLKLFSGSLLILRSSASNVYWDNSLSPKMRCAFILLTELRIQKQTRVRQRTLICHENNEVLRLVSKLEYKLAYLWHKFYQIHFQSQWNSFFAYLGVEWKVVEVKLARMLLRIPPGQCDWVCPSREDFCWNVVDVFKMSLTNPTICSLNQGLWIKTRGCAIMSKFELPSRSSEKSSGIASSSSLITLTEDASSTRLPGETDSPRAFEISRRGLQRKVLSAGPRSLYSVRLLRSWNLSLGSYQRRLRS